MALSRVKRITISVLGFICAFCMFLVALFSINVTTQAAVSAADFAYPEGGYTALKANGKFSYSETISAAQGVNGWYKLYGMVDSYQEMTNDNGTWKGSATYCQLYGNQNIVAENDDVILMWKAEKAGTVVFDGAFFALAEAPESDGVKIMMHNRKAEGQAATELFSCEFPNGMTYAIDLSAENEESGAPGLIQTKFEVVAGEMIYFSVNCRETSGYDNTFVWLHATFTESQTQEPDTDVPTAVDFPYPSGGYTALKANNKFPYAEMVSAAQGVNGWYKLYGTVDSYQEMTNDNGIWKGSATYCQLYGNQNIVAENDDVILMWKAEKAGTVVFDGAFFALAEAPESDGVKIMMHNRKAEGQAATELFSCEFPNGMTYAIDLSAENEESGAPGLIQTKFEVVAGEMIYFSVNCRETSGYDNTFVWLHATFTESQTQEPEPEINCDCCDETCTGECICVAGQECNTDCTCGGENCNVQVPEDTFAYPEGGYSVLAGFEKYDYHANVGTTQGVNGWYKVYGSVDSYSKMHYGNNYQLGGSEMWMGPGVYSMITEKQVINPDGSDTIMLWQADKNGSVKFDGAIFKMGLNGTEDFDGVRILIHKKEANGTITKLFDETFTTNFAIDITGGDITNTYDVSAGDMFLFSVNQVQTCNYDSVYVWLNATLTENTDNPGTAPVGIDDVIVTDAEDPYLSYAKLKAFNAHPYSESIGEEQGSNNWYKLYGNVLGDYYEMTYDSSNGAWMGTSAVIYNKQDAIPYPNEDIIFMWRAPFNGTVSFSGAMFIMDVQTGDGVTLSIYNRKSLADTSSELFKKTYSLSFAKEIEMTDLTVVAGEMYYFVINGNKTVDYDAVFTWLWADFVKNEDNPGTAPGDDLGTATLTQDDFNSYFGTNQNTNGWYYLYGQADGVYYKMEYNENSEWWAGADAFCQIEIMNQHPGNTDDAIKMWRASADGTAKVTLNTYGISYDQGNGVKILVHRRNVSDTGYSAAELLWSKEMTEIGVKEQWSAELTVKNGDMLFFSVDSLGVNANDSTILNVYVDFTKTADGVNPGDDIGEYRPIDTTSWYGTTQGANGWFYAYGSINKYAFSKYVETSERWVGDTDTQLILSGYQHPSNDFASIRLFVAGGTGKINLRGYAQKLQSEGGDGVKAAIYHNGTELWSKDFAYTDTERVDLSSLGIISVNKGDIIAFVLDAKSENRYDMFNFGVEITWAEKGDDFTDDATVLASYLNPVDPFELKGGNNVEDEIPDENPDSKGGCGSNVATTSLAVAILVLLSSVVVLTIKRRKE